MKNLKSEKGITLVDITIYMIAILITIGIMAIVRNYFFQNLDAVKNGARYAEEFDNFNAFFVKDVKSYTDIEVDDSSKIYKFIGGTNGLPDVEYNYIPYSGVGDIYRGSVKVATNVRGFKIVRKSIYVNDTKKYLLYVDILIGTASDSSNKIFSKSMMYTMNYWDRLN